MAEPRIWALLGPRLGDNNQVLALAEALGLPFEAKNLEYNHWRHLRPGLLGASILSLTRESRTKVSGDPPDLAISTGIRSVPVAQWLRRRSGGRTLLVHLGYPRISPGRFDLVVTTPEYPIADHSNLRRIPFALTRSGAGRHDEQLQSQFPAPRRLLIVGGPSLYWSLGEGSVIGALRTLLARAGVEGGSVLAVGSPRTPAPLVEAIRREIAGATVPAFLAPTKGSPSYAALVEATDEIHVTADSVAMVSDAIVTGKPVGLVLLDRSPLGRAWLGTMDRLRPGKRVHPRDLRFFWRTLADRKLVGTIEKPRNGSVPNLVEDVAAYVQSLLEDQAGRLERSSSPSKIFASEW